MLAGVIGVDEHSVHAAGLDLLSPLATRGIPTATFGAWSQDTFHPGIDFSTGGVSMPVAAAADGEVVRVRASGSGYGKALHLAIGDGSEIVYAHLASFAPEIEDSCLALQRRAGSYEIDWTPPAGLFPVRTGSWLGWTGETPDGRSVLHMEFRIGGIPRNPWLNGFSWRDHDPPRIEAVEFVPLAASSRINGRLATLAVEIGAGGSALGSPVLWGPVGLVCRAQDVVSGTRCAPWRFRAEIDGAVLSEGNVGSAAFDGRAWDAIDPEPPAQPSGSFVIPLFDSLRGDRGRIAAGTAVPPGAHRLRITCLDASGNSDTCTIGFRVLPSPRVSEWIVRPLPGRAWDLAVQLAPLEGIDPEQVRFWIDLTEDGLRYPVHQRLGHLGDGFFVGKILGHVPAGPIGMRVRFLTPDGREVFEPPLSLDGAGGCSASALDSPQVQALPRWMLVGAHAECLPSRSPRASLRIGERVVPCDLLETSVDGADWEQARGRGGWWFAAAPGGLRAGATPMLELEVGGVRRSWRLDGVVSAGPRTELLWSSADGALTVEAAAGSFYAPVWLSWSRTARGDARVPPGELPRSTGSPFDQDEVLLVRSDVHRLDPGGMRPDGLIRVSLRPRVPPETAQEARRLLLFGRADADQPWTSRGGLWTGSGVTALVDRLEEWIVLEDRTEPWLYALRPGEGERTRSSGLEVSAGIRENGSGLVPGDVEVLLDGVKLPAKWNPWSRRVTAVQDSGLAAGPHRWRILVRDRAGNEARRDAAFIVVEEP